MKLWIVGVVAFACTGCTTLSLERHTLAQGNSVAELRYLEVLQNLAMVAHNPAALPAYSSIFAGTAQITDTGQLGSTTLWVTGGIMSTIRSGFLSEQANPQLSRAVSENWSLDPLIAPEKIEALRCACQWVVYGPEMAWDSSPGLLSSPDQCPTPGRHFGVADRLGRLPSGWLHVGRVKDVPLAARYKAHSGHTWVWVTPEGMGGLADFTLVFQDIARVAINSDSLFYWPPPPCVYTRVSKSKPKDKKAEVGDKNANQRIAELGTPRVWIGDECAGTQGVNAARPADLWPESLRSGALMVSAYIDRDYPRKLWVSPYRKLRLDNLAVDSSLRSQVNAAGAP